MTLREKLGQLFIVGIHGTQLTKEEEAFLVNNHIGGVVLMGRNCQSPEQVHQLLLYFGGYGRGASGSS
jgi:beta-N-acetylhexosaminidase